MPSTKFKVLRRIKGLVDGDAAKGKAPSVNEPGDIVALDNGDERIEALVKSKAIAPASADEVKKAAATASQSKPTGTKDDGKSNGKSKSDGQPDKLDPAALQAMSVEDLRKIAADEFEFAPASVAKLSKDELLALIAEAIAKAQKA